MLNWKVVCLSLSLLFAISFVLCVLWGLITPPAMHMHALLELVLPGFRWLSAGSFILGLLESCLWGIYIGAIYVPIHNVLQAKLDRPGA